MKPLKKIASDPAFWSLVLMNVLFVKYFSDHPNTFKTYLWIYWFQSITIGLFNFIALLTITKVVAGSITLNGQPIDEKYSNRGCVSFFFLVHYGFFHLGYAIFIASGFKEYGKFDFSLFKYAAGIIILNQLIWFIQNKIKTRGQAVNIGKQFFTPYLRIIPMHLSIIVPAFIHMPSMEFFLILKIFMDIIMHLITTNWYWKDEERTIGDIANTDLM